jgi:hypothetical protein
MRRRTSLGVSVLATVVLVTGCGGGTASEVPPSVTGPLARVDRATVTGDPDAVAPAVRSLLRAVEDAEDEGAVDADRADRIRAAAAALLEAVRSAEPSPEPTRSPAPTDESSEQSGAQSGESGEDGDDEEDEDDAEEGGGPGRGEGRGKEKD